MLSPSVGPSSSGSSPRQGRASLGGSSYGEDWACDDSASLRRGGFHDDSLRRGDVHGDSLPRRDVHEDSFRRGDVHEDFLRRGDVHEDSVTIEDETEALTPQQQDQLDRHHFRRQQQQRRLQQQQYRHDRWSASEETEALHQLQEQPEVHRATAEKKKKKRFQEVRVVSEDDADLNRNVSFPFLTIETLNNARRSQDLSPTLLRGPRRVFRLCLFAVLVPLALILLPLYIRLVVYPPESYAMAPSDQRLVDRRVSSIWCQGQSVQMNGSFNAYLVPHDPPTSSTRQHHEILRKVSLRDDVKEYWGFYLKEGTSIRLNACTRYDGGQLMILRGVENLHRCAWIGEEDSVEEFLEHPPTPEELASLRLSSDADSDEYEEALTRLRIGSTTFKATGEEITLEGNDDIKANNNLYGESTGFATSHERKGHLSLLLGKALRLSKGKNELLNMLEEHHAALTGTESPATEANEMNAAVFKLNQSASYVDSAGTKANQSEATTENDINNQDFENLQFSKSHAAMLRQSLTEENNNGAFEVIDDDDVDTVRVFTKDEIKVEQIIGGLEIPDGLTYERGFVNQSRGHDLSAEEERSSYSSSEEALASCEGVILALPLQPDSKCTGFDRQGSNRLSYDIAVDGTYYFVFSSDNEIVVNELFFNLTMDKVVYDTTDNLANCTASNNCSLSIGFWSEDKTVVEVVPNGSWDDSFVLRTTCEPRVALYLSFMLLVPMIILFCAFQ